MIDIHVAADPLLPGTNAESKIGSDRLGVWATEGIFPMQHTLADFQ
jgi:hypothetical protein